MEVQSLAVPYIFLSSASADRGRTPAMARRQLGEPAFAAAYAAGRALSLAQAA
jgi:hypothetical protein